MARRMNSRRSVLVLVTQQREEASDRYHQTSSETQGGDLPLPAAA